MDKKVLSPLKPLVNNTKLLNGLFDYLDETIKLYQISLEKSTDLVEVHRMQGAIASMRKLKYIREEVNGE